MITLIFEMLGISLLFIGGGVFQAGYFLLGLTLSGVGAISLGTLFAAVQTCRTAGTSDGFETTEGLTVRQLMAYVLEHEVDMDTHVYVGYRGLDVASGTFNCLLDGRRALVIERKDS